ncbi:MAG: hypothetical protein AB1611_18790 [bacterium]
MKRKILIRDGQLWLDNICLLPVISGKVSFAQEVREAFFSTSFDCLALGLPESFYPLILQGVQALPYVTTVIAQDREDFYSYFPVDPCDGMIEAIRLGMQEGKAIRFIDREMNRTFGHDILSTGLTVAGQGLILPDEYAVSQVGLPPYIQAVFPSLASPQGENQRGELQRQAEEDIQARFMAARLQELSLEHRKVLFVFSLHHLRAILHFYQAEYRNVPNGDRPQELKLYSVHPDSLYFILGEIPYFTYLYEKVKGTLLFEEFQKAEAIKKLLMETRDEYQREFPEEIYHISCQDVQTALQLIRNLCLIKNRLTPDLYELVAAAKGVMGNDFALKLIEIAKFYPYMDVSSTCPTIKMTSQFISLDRSVWPVYRRVPALAKEWKRLRLEKKPSQKQKKHWATCWNPNTVCSWPPEDEIIENFCGYIRKRALKLVGLSQVRVEEFQSTLKDGLHVRETMRNLHLGKIYVKEEPQIQGEVGAVVFIFDEDPDGEKYPYKLTWLAEHQNESTLAFYATDFKNDLVGPGISRCFYGGAMFLYPPQLIEDVWSDPRFDAAANNIERLMMAGLYYSQDRYVAVVARHKPPLSIQDYARLQQKRLVFLPLSSFSHTRLQKLRYFHVLNGKQVRSWASRFIRGGS